MNASDRHAAEGRQRLARLMPEARREARATLTSPHASSMTPMSMLGLSVLSHLREDNLDTLVVYESPPGSWYADLVLKNVPAGVPDTLGTPVAHPLGSREEAEEAARVLLVGLLAEIHTAAIAGRDTPQKDIRVFRLHDIEFSVPGDAVDDLLEHHSKIFAELPIPPVEFSYGMLRETCAEIAGEREMDEETWQAADPALRDRAMMAIMLLLTLDIFQFPLDRFSPPPR